MNHLKSLAIASLIISLTVSCLDAQAQTTSPMRPTEIPPQLFYEIEIDPNLPPEIPASTPTASPPTHCQPHRVLSVSWNKNSTLIAIGIGSGYGTQSCPFSGALQIFDMSGEYPRLTHTVHTADWLWSVTFSPDDTQLITGGDDDTVNVFEGISPFNHLQVLPEAKGDVRTVAINSHGTLLAAGGHDTEVRLYLKNRTNFFNHVKTLSNSSTYIEEIDFNPINGQLAVGERLRRVITYSGINPYNPLKILLDSMSQISAVTYNPDGTLLTSGDTVRQVRFYNGTNPDDPLHTLSVPGQISRIAYNPNGTRVAVAQRDGKVVVFEGIKPFSHLYTLPPGRSREAAFSLAYSRDGKWLVIGKGKIVMYRVDGARLPTTQAITSKAPTSIAATSIAATSIATTTAVNTTQAVTETGREEEIESNTKEYNSSTLTALSVVTLLTALFQGMILQ